MSHCCDHQHPHPATPAPSNESNASRPRPAGARLSRLRIEQMDCPTEQGLIEARLGKLAGVHALEFNLLSRVLGVWHELPDELAIIAAIDELGFSAQPLATDQPGAAAVAPPAKPWWPLALAGVAALAAELLHFSGLAPDWAVAGVALLAILLCGLSTYKKGWVALKNRNLNINALMSIAVTGAVLIGQWPEAAMVMVLFSLAELIEAKSLDRARQAIHGLLALTPEQATVQQPDGSWQSVPTSQVAIGAQVRVRPGERIGLDGVVSAGQSTVNQAPITGESLPVDKAAGDPLFAGTINQGGELHYQVSAAADNSTLARIIHAVEQAQGARAPTQRFVDQFSRIYTPTVFALAVAVALLPPLLLGGAWLEWAYRALVLLVIACPCALVISTPVTIVSGLAAAARRGILIKGGVYLELGHQLRALALDKTGTLTHGRPVQTDYLALHRDACDPAQLAASLAQRSDHPVSQAIARHAEAQGLSLLALDNFSALPGRGVSGLLDGQLYQLGNHRLVEELGLCNPALEALLEPLERQGKSLVLLCSTDRVLALFAVADTLKASSQEAISELHELGVKTCMLSGDNAHTAAAIAQQAGIDEAQGNLLPEHKLAAIHTLQGNGQIVGMVGDGINDAPALAQANIGFAMAAAGSDSAIETADVALMDDDLRKIPAFIRLSRRTARILKQNIALALGVKALFLLITLTGHATLWMAVFADMGVSLLVVANGLRLLRQG